ncbi:NO-inducible flavohemoprotein [Paenibacillus pasadenensis]|uniref:NO-inducible flavohemoprotein n=1 Tax=Paenibacillus pasadenensis TaxID=217090 RepID=UPI00203DAF79|nr:NO-inducible flavohemoprotein [Paenibacillus pasadenensis]MCM3747810.1 NO-inducible flavohemoprotein [Paenibacillus pasadenensis]
MLNPDTIAIIKSTVPVLKVHGTAITRRFYERLFTAHPELLNLFNHANQKQGRQQEALANTVYAAALHIDKLEAILPVVRQIAHKHRSLGVTADQYAVVGENLLAAISEVLGDAATEPILQAWGDAYGVIANVFIEVEKDLYRQAEEAKGGWAGYREFKVQRKVKESEQVFSFYLVPLDGGELPAFLPGQYISAKMAIPGHENTHIRQYSLSDAPGKPYYRISVKREDAIPQVKPAGTISSYLHSSVEEGDVLKLSAPAGDFTLNVEDKRPVVLLSNGIGVTPMLSMLETLAVRNQGRKVTFIHANRCSADQAQYARVQELLGSCLDLSVRWSYMEPEAGLDAVNSVLQSQIKPGFINAEWLKEFVPAEGASYYFCGSVPFMREVYNGLLACGVPVEDLHYEFFGPATDITGLPEQAAAPVS